MIISRTPYRISFFGGGSDYPDWYKEHGGQVLATTIDKYCYITARYLPPFFEHKYRVAYSEIENVSSIDDIQHPAARETLKFLNFDRGVEIHHDGDLPARSGIGSSSSFTVGLLNVLHALEGRMVSKVQLTAEAIYIERERLGEAVGSQDQTLAAYGGFNHIEFNSSADAFVRPITIPSERLHELNDHLMLFYTGKRIEGSSKITECDLKAISDMVDKGLSILQSKGDIARFGDLLHEAWKAKALVSNHQVDAIYDCARSHGAIGGKLLGAGGGGFMLLFAHPSLQSKVKAALSTLIHVPFKFESSGSQIIFFDREEDFENRSTLS